MAAVANWAIGICIGACALSCYFAACNIALKTFSRARLSELLARRGRLGQLDAFVVRQPRLVLMTGTLRTFLNLVVLLAVLAWFEGSYPDWRPWLVYLLSFLVAGALVSVFGVAIPISIARYVPEDLLARSMPLLHAVHVLLRPMVSALHLFDPLVRRLSGADAHRDHDSPLTQELLSVVEEHQEEAGVDQTQKQMLEAVIDLPTTTVGEIMTPRTEMQGIEIESSLEDVKAAILRDGHSRIPVYEGSLDHILGLLYAKDVIAFLGQTDQPFDLRKLLREALMVPESKPVRELLAEFKARKVHIAIVVDEYGGTAGLVTIEDIIEEIVGEIHDEYEETQEQPMIKRVDDHTVEVDARLHIDDLADAFGMHVPDDRDYGTVGGFVFANLGHIPQAQETFDFEGVRVTVLEAERTKVKRVRFQKLDTADEPPVGPGA